VNQATRETHEGRAPEPARPSDLWADLELACARLDELTERLNQLGRPSNESAETAVEEEPTIASIVQRNNEAWQAGRVQSLYLRRLRARLRRR
jgi:hypothetical protein